MVSNKAKWNQTVYTKKFRARFHLASGNNPAGFVALSEKCIKKVSAHFGQKPFSLYQRQHLVDVGIDTDGLPPDLLRTNCLPLVDTGVGGVRILRRHLPEGIFDDDGGVVANA